MPLAGAVLNAINARLDAAGVAFILRHGRAKLVLVDREFGAPASQAMAGMDQAPVLIDINDAGPAPGSSVRVTDYESLLEEGDPTFEGVMPADEWDLNDT